MPVGLFGLSLDISILIIASTVALLFFIVSSAIGWKYGVSSESNFTEATYWEIPRSTPNTIYTICWWLTSIAIAVAIAAGAVALFIYIFLQYEPWEKLYGSYVSTDGNQRITFISDSQVKRVCLTDLLSEDSRCIKMEFNLESEQDKIKIIKAYEIKNHNGHELVDSNSMGTHESLRIMVAGYDTLLVYSDSVEYVTFTRINMLSPITMNGLSVLSHWMSDVEYMNVVVEKFPKLHPMGRFFLQLDITSKGRFILLAKVPMKTIFAKTSDGKRDFKREILRPGENAPAILSDLRSVITEVENHIDTIYVMEQLQDSKGEIACWSICWTASQGEGYKVIEDNATGKVLTKIRVPY